MSRIEDISTLGKKILNEWGINNAKNLGLQVCTMAIEALIDNDRLRAERDALTELINSQTHKPIEDCKHYDSCYKEAYDAFKPLQCPICRKWELHGLEGRNEQSV